MTSVMDTHDLALRVSETDQVSARLVRPPDAHFLYLLAHGAGAGMRHPFMEDIAHLLADRSVATLRYQFPYMEAGRPRPDSPARAEATVRAAAEFALELAPDLRIIAGGKSYGGRMTSTAQAKSPLPGVRGLAFLGFPLHAPAKPSDKRAEHLTDILVPMLFMQGTRDPLADLSLLRPVTERLFNATVHVVPEGDHSFKVPKRTGRTVDDIMTELADTVAGWVTGI